MFNNRPRGEAEMHQPCKSGCRATCCCQMQLASPTILGLSPILPGTPDTTGSTHMRSPVHVTIKPTDMLGESEE